MPKFAPKKPENKKLASKKSVPSCVACQGKGISSKGGRCHPCMGSGKKLSFIRTVPKKPKYVLDIEKTTGLSCVFLDVRLNQTRWNVISPTGFVVFTVSSIREETIGEATYPNLWDLTGHKHA